MNFPYIYFSTACAKAALRRYARGPSGRGQRPRRRAGQGPRRTVPQHRTPSHSARATAALSRRNREGPGAAPRGKRGRASRLYSLAPPRRRAGRSQVRLARQRAAPEEAARRERSVSIKYKGRKPRGLLTPSLEVFGLTIVPATFVGDCGLPRKLYVITLTTKSCCYLFTQTRRGDPPSGWVPSRAPPSQLGRAPARGERPSH